MTGGMRLRSVLETVLADGEWHEVSDVRAAVADAVPSVVAIRRQQTERESSRRQGRAVSDGDLPADVMALAGAKRYANQAMQNARRDGRVEVSDGMIRLVRNHPPLEETT